MIDLDAFRNAFEARTAGWSWQIQGILDAEGRVHPLDTDTKLISTVFERLAYPVICSLAQEAGYVVETANQTTYPDFTLSQYQHGALMDRIALDIKSTYRSARMRLTLGGYNSFLRDENKSILFPYSTYRAHWVLGFVYTQRPAQAAYNMGSRPQAHEIQGPYSDVVTFLRTKEDLAGLRPGSGNTKNMGSIWVREAEHFMTLQGPFAAFEQPKQACDHYWRHYERFAQGASPVSLLEHPEFLSFGPHGGQQDV